MEQAFGARSRISSWQALGLSLLLHGMLAGALLLWAGTLHHAMPLVPHEGLHLTLLAGPAAAPARLTAASPEKPQRTPSSSVPHLVAVSHPVAEPAALGSPAVSPAPLPVSPSATATAPAAVTSPSAPVATVGAAQLASAPDAAGAASPASADTSFVAASSDAAYLNNQPPAYPPLARRQGIEGQVLLRVVVSREGLPLSVSVFSSSHHSALDKAALAAVSLWRFVPAHRGAVAVEDTIRVPIHFNLTTLAATQG